MFGQSQPIRKKEFETELKSDSELRNEVKFEKEIQSAITEKDVLNLREKLETVSKQGNESPHSIF
jgi:hypothetical protein